MYTLYPIPGGPELELISERICEYCGDVFSSESSCKRHSCRVVSVHHTIPRSDVSSPRVEKRHPITKPVLPWKCPFCEMMSFRLKSQLKAHVRYTHEYMYDGSCSIGYRRRGRDRPDAGQDPKFDRLLADTTKLPGV